MDMIILGPPVHVTKFICHAQVCSGNRRGTCSSGYWKVTFAIEFCTEKRRWASFTILLVRHPH
jgi:hypothetical protein